MGKSFITLLTVLMLVCTALMLHIPAATAADEADTVCGKSFMYVLDYQMYLLKFTSENPSLPDCSMGTMGFYWDNQMRTFFFNTQDIFFVNLYDLKTGKLLKKLTYHNKVLSWPMEDPLEFSIFN